MTIPYILAVGFSHIHTLRRAYLESKKAGKCGALDIDFVAINSVEKYNPFYSWNAAELVYNEHLLSDIRSLASKRAPNLIVGFFWSSQHFTISALNDPRPFDFTIPNDPIAWEINSDAETVPYDLIRALMKERCRIFSGLAPRVREITGRPVYLISAPPPIANLAANPAATPPDLIDKVSELGIAPESLRYKAWKLCEELFRENCRDEDVPFVPAPRQTMDERSFLREQYIGNDWIHGNSAYGHLVLSQIMDIPMLNDQNGLRPLPQSA